MGYKIQIQIIVAMSVITLSSQRAMDESGKTCTLEAMKIYAARACEDIFLRSTRSIHKRHILNEITDDINYISDTKYVTKGYRSGWRPYKIRRRDYPKGGYLLLDHLHAKVLSRKNQDPEYYMEPSKFHSKKYHYAGLRDKRNGDERIQVHYCCEKRCDIKDFCKR